MSSQVLVEMFGERGVLDPTGSRAVAENNQSTLVLSGRPSSGMSVRAPESPVSSSIRCPEKPNGSHLGD